MRGYTIEGAEDEFRTKEFKTHVIAPYRNAATAACMVSPTDRCVGSRTGRRPMTPAPADWQLRVRLFEWYHNYFKE